MHESNETKGPVRHLIASRQIEVYSKHRIISIFLSVLALFGLTILVSASLPGLGQSVNNNEQQSGRVLLDFVDEARTLNPTVDRSLNPTPSLLHKTRNPTVDRSLNPTPSVLHKTRNPTEDWTLNPTLISRRTKQPVGFVGEPTFNPTLLVPTEYPTFPPTEENQQSKSRNPTPTPKTFNPTITPRTVNPTLDSIENPQQETV